MSPNPPDCPLRALLDGPGPAPESRLAPDDAERIANRVVDMLDHLARDRVGMIWLSSERVAERTDVHARTVRAALLDGELHGHRIGGKGRWRVHAAAVDAWVVGGDQVTACGCTAFETERRGRQQRGR